MAGSQDDLFGNHHPEQAQMDELQAFREALFGRISEAVDEHEIPDGLIPLLLAEIAVTFRATGYALAAEKPSASGLKLDLDRFRREIDEIVRAIKKSADEFVASAREARAEELPDEPE
jgi:hypothetical protein